MQCIICKNEDQPANLTAVRSPSWNGYAHQRCIDQHNKTVAKNLRGLDASWIATMIIEHDLDATDPYKVAEFLRREKPEQYLMGSRCPTVDEVVAAACEWRERNRIEALFERLEEEVEPWPAEANAAFIGQIADDLRVFVPLPIGLPGRGNIAGLLARLLAQQVAWRKHTEAMKAACEEYDQSEQASVDQGQTN
jgi:hypothetical protein